ncbi:MAG: exodeoxyribonuclease V subunit alpha [Pseudonocardia sp.]
MTALIKDEPATDPHDPRFALRASGLLAQFNAAGVLAAADVHVAIRLGRLGDERDEAVLLAVAFVVRGIRLGSVCLELGALRRTVLGEGDELVDVSALPWPVPGPWRAACERSPIITSGPDASGGRPLRMTGGLLYLERYWHQEEQVRRDLRHRAAAGPAPVDIERLRAGLTRLFPPGEPERQRLAAAASALRRVTVLAGGPGTGKTTTVARLLALLADLGGRDQPSPPRTALAASTDGRGVGPRPADPVVPRIALAAPTGKAAARLEEAVRTQVATLPPEDRDRLGELRASTLHRLLGWRPGASSRFRHDRSNRLPFDVIVVDETSMVSLTLMARLLEAVRPDARLVLVGDPDQLASVEAGAVLSDLARATGTPEPALDAALRELGVAGPEPVINGVVTLNHTFRFTGAIADLARAVQSGDPDAAVAMLRGRHPDVVFTETPGDTAGLRADVVAAGQTMIEAAQAGEVERALEALEAHRVLCGHRRGPFGVTWWSAEIERWLADTLPMDTGEWYPGRPVLITTNDYDVDLYNGDTGVVVQTAGGPRVAFSRGGTPTLLAPARLPDVQTVHAMTVHRGQGSQFARVTVVLPPAESPLLTRELLYTAITRARAAVRIVGSEAAVRAAVARPVSRASGLRHRLNGPADGTGVGTLPA